MNKLKERIKQRIWRRRGEYKKERKKKFSYLRHTGQIDDYYEQRKLKPRTIIPAVQELKWWQKIIKFFSNQN